MKYHPSWNRFRSIRYSRIDEYGRLGRFFHNNTFMDGIVVKYDSCSRSGYNGLSRSGFLTAVFK